MTVQYCEIFEQTEQGLTTEQGLAAQQTAVINLAGVGGFMPSQTGAYTHKNCMHSHPDVVFRFFSFLIGLCN